MTRNAQGETRRFIVAGARLEALTRKSEYKSPQDLRPLLIRNSQLTQLIKKSAQMRLQSLLCCTQRITQKKS